MAKKIYGEKKLFQIKSNQIKSNDGSVVRSTQRNRGLLRITTIKYM